MELVWSSISDSWHLSNFDASKIMWFLQRTLKTLAPPKSRPISFLKPFKAILKPLKLFFSNAKMSYNSAELTTEEAGLWIIKLSRINFIIDFILIKYWSSYYHSSLEVNVSSALTSIWFKFLRICIMGTPKSSTEFCSRSIFKWEVLPY